MYTVQSMSTSKHDNIYTRDENLLIQNLAERDDEIERLRAALQELVHNPYDSEGRNLAALDRVRAAITKADPVTNTSIIEPFVVKYYIGEERPSIKGNGFDGLEVGTVRTDAQEFVDWLNAKLACALSVSPSALQGTNSNDISTLDGTQDALRMRCSTN